VEKPAELNINLLSSPKRNRVPNYMVWAAGLLALLFLIFACIYILQHKIIVNQQAENKNLKAALESSRSKEEFYKSLQTLDQAMNARNKAIQAITENKLSYVEVINQIDRFTLEPLMIVGIEINPQRVILNGYSPRYSDISRLLDGLKASPGFDDVALLSSDMNEAEGEIKFTLEIDREASSQ
jgi:Fimbrial assembly protein (PilN).